MSDEYIRRQDAIDAACKGFCHPEGTFGKRGKGVTNRENFTLLLITLVCDVGMFILFVLEKDYVACWILTILFIAIVKELYVCAKEI